MHERPRQPARGYILAATLLWLALLAVIAVRLAQRVDLLRQQSSYASDLADAVTNASSARALAIFRMATGRMAQNGFVASSGAALPLDGRYTAIAGDAGNRVSVSVQDERGLLSVNLLDRPVIAQLLVRQGVPEGSVDHLIDSLEDYTDTDSLRRLKRGPRPTDYERRLDCRRHATTGWCRRTGTAPGHRLARRSAGHRQAAAAAVGPPRRLLQRQRLAPRGPGRALSRAPPQQIDEFMTAAWPAAICQRGRGAQRDARPAVLRTPPTCSHPSDQYRLNAIRSTNSPIGGSPPSTLSG